MKVLGIDPAPGSGGHVFNGSLYRHLSAPHLTDELKRYKEERAVLICWDAPLTGPPNPDQCLGIQGEFTQRSIDRFFNRSRWGFKTPKGISVTGYAGCQHWAISRHMLGLPRVSPWDIQEISLPFTLLTSAPPTNLGHYIVEVHPALALWLWCGFGDDPWIGSWLYKKDQGILGNLWWKLCSRLFSRAPDVIKTLAERGTPESDDDLDSRLAWLLGKLWLAENGVVLLGNREQGTFLVPDVQGLQEAFSEFGTEDITSRK